MIAGNFPPKQTKYIVAWADIHREELAVLWEIMQNDEEYFKIRGVGMMTYPKLQAVTPLDNYMLALVFSNGEKRL